MKRFMLLTSLWPLNAETVDFVYASGLSLALFCHIGNNVFTGTIKHRLGNGICLQLIKE